MWGLFCYPFQSDKFRGLAASNEEPHEKINHQSETVEHHQGV